MASKYNKSLLHSDLQEVKKNCPMLNWKDEPRGDNTSTNR
jgi:hypothetical protein